MEGSPLTRPGSDQVESRDLLVQAESVAAQLWEFAAGSYGPRAGSKLVATAPDRSVPLESAASALREAGPDAPLVAPYLRLVEELQKQVGDQATTGLLLAAGLVRAAAGAVARGDPVAAYLDGYRLARRQALSELEALATAASPDQCLAAIGPWAASGVQGIEALAEQGPVRLDHILVRPEPVQEPAWADGVVAPLAGARARVAQGERRVLLTTKSIDHKPRQDAATVVRDAATATAWQQDDPIAPARERLLAAGVGLWACHRSIDDEVATAMHARGILTWSSIGKDEAVCLQAASGSRLLPGPEAVDADDLGVVHVRPRPRPHRDWILEGPGFAATWIVPSAGGPEETAKDRAEQILRAAAPVLADARAVAGGGRWQGHLSKRIAAVAPQGPGKSPLGIEAAAKVFRHMLMALRRSDGQDPLGRSYLGAEIMDAYPCVRRAVADGFDTAITILRADALYQKRPSGAQDLRGNLGPAGSPKGMPGDIPPLM